jgi:inosose dehydratase
MKLARNRNWSFLDAVIAGAFTVPGDGAVDFPAIIARLKRHGYRGWLVVEAEQDPVVAPSYKYAQMGFRTLRALVDAPPGALDTDTNTNTDAARQEAA